MGVTWRSAVFWTPPRDIRAREAERLTGGRPPVRPQPRVLGPRPSTGMTSPSTSACRHRMAAAYTCKILTARAAIRSTATTEIADSSAISAFVFLVRGIASVGLKAIEFVVARYR